MEEQDKFTDELFNLINQDQEWFNNVCLPQTLEQYRLLYTCVKNLYELLTQRSLIVPDPYRHDKKISAIEVPDTEAYSENEKKSVIGMRFSEYETMLDFVCTYTRFSVENLTLGKIKKLQALNNCFYWLDFSTNSTKPNTRGLATLLNEAKMNATGMVMSLISDNIAQCASAMTKITENLSKLTVLQCEIYKMMIRKDLLSHPSFDKGKAYQSPEAEFNEIKRLFPEVIGKKPFFTELIRDIVKEDIGQNKEKVRQELFAKLQVVEETKKVKKKKIDPREYLIVSLNTLGALFPIYEQIIRKMQDNVGLFTVKSKSIFNKLIEAIKKSMNVQPKDQIFNVPITDSVTKAKTQKKINVTEFIIDLQRKLRIYQAIATKSNEYEKILAATDSAIVNFIGKHVTENQSVYTTVAVLDEYFKNAIPLQNRPQIKGMKMDLDTLKNTVIGANKKKGEYQSILEEAEQMKKLGIEDE